MSSNTGMNKICISTKIVTTWVRCLEINAQKTTLCDYMNHLQKLLDGQHDFVFFTLTNQTCVADCCLFCLGSCALIYKGPWPASLISNSNTPLTLYLIWSFQNPARTLLYCLIPHTPFLPSGLGATEAPKRPRLTHHPLSARHNQPKDAAN